MKKVICSLISVLASAFVLSHSFCSFAEEKQVQKTVEVHTPQYMLVLGDSISTGYGLANYKSKNNYNTESYANLLAKKYKLTGEKDCFNLAIDGQTSNELLSRVKSGNYQDYLKNSDLVLISIGGNDLLGELLTFLSKCMDSVSIEEGSMPEFDFTNPDILSSLNSMITEIDKNITNLKGNLVGITRLIKDVNPETHVIFQTVYNPTDDIMIPDMLSEVFVSKINEVNKIIKTNAKNDDGSDFYYVADVFEEFSGHASEYTNISSMDIHPNSSGHKIISECIGSIVSSLTFKASVTVTEEIQSDISLPSVQEEKTSPAAWILFIVSVVVIIAGTAFLVLFFKKRKAK